MPIHKVFVPNFDNSLVGNFEFCLGKTRIKFFFRVFLTEEDFTNAEERNGPVYSFINDKQREAFASIFYEMDKNKDGKIDIEELKQNLFPLASKSNLKHLLQVLCFVLASINKYRLE